MNKWQPYTGNYEKKWYDIKTMAKNVYSQCWPNAGTFHVSNTSVGDIVIDGAFVTHIRVSSKTPFGDNQEHTPPTNSKETP